MDGMVADMIDDVSVSVGCPSTSTADGRSHTHEAQNRKDKTFHSVFSTLVVGIATIICLLTKSTRQDEFLTEQPVE